MSPPSPTKGGGQTQFRTRKFIESTTALLFATNYFMDIPFDYGIGFIVTR